MLVDILSSRSLSRELRDFWTLLAWSMEDVLSNQSYLSKASLVSKIEKASNAILAGLEIEILNETEPENSDKYWVGRRMQEGVHVPFAKTRIQVHNCLAAINLPKARCVGVQHFIRGLRKESSDVNVGDALTILKTLGQRHLRRVSPHSRDSSGNWWLLLRQHLKILEDIAGSGLHHLQWQTCLSQLLRDIAWITREAGAIDAWNGRILWLGSIRGRWGT